MSVIGHLYMTTSSNQRKRLRHHQHPKSPLFSCHHDFRVIDSSPSGNHYILLQQGNIVISGFLDSENTKEQGESYLGYSISIAYMNQAY